MRYEVVTPTKTQTRDTVVAVQRTVVWAMCAMPGQLVYAHERLEDGRVRWICGSVALDQMPLEYQDQQAP